MSNSLLHRYNSTAGTIPAASALKIREIGINTADGILYIQTSAGAIKAINPAFGIVPLTTTYNMGTIPTNAANFYTTVQGATVGQNVICSVGGITNGISFPDELEMEPMGVAGMVVSANTIYFSLYCCGDGILTTGLKTINFYLG